MMKRRLLELCVRLPAMLMASLPVLKFLYNIDWIKDLNKLPVIGKLEFIKDINIFNAFVVIGIVYIIAKIWLTFIDMGEDSTASKEIHNFLHELRNTVIDFSYIDPKIYTSSDDGLEHFYKFVQKTSETLCEHIFNFLKAYSSKNFSVCIKMINPTSSRKTISKNEIEIKTLCRAGVNKTARGAKDLNEKIMLVDNTDFELIFDSDGSESTNVFATHNLPFYIFQKHFTKTPYKTSTKHPLKKYWSTVVVPIRIANKYLPPNRRTDDTLYSLVAFLCIDYRYILRRYEIKKLKNYIKAMGDAFYPFFEQVFLIDECIRKSNK